MSGLPPGRLRRSARLGRRGRLAWLSGLALSGLLIGIACLAATPARPTTARSALPTRPALPSTATPPLPTTAAPIGQALPRSSSAPVVPGVPLQFPRDYGSHPQFGIEWWYLTGWLRTARHQPLGFQITFFRVRTGADAANPSAFAPRQLLIAHAAISDPARGRLWQDQRIRRAGLGLAQAAVGDTHVWMDDWSLQRRDGGSSGPGGSGPGSGRGGGPDGGSAPGGDSRVAAHGNVYVAHVAADDFGFDLTATADSPPMLNGNAGFSQKGPEPRSASYYYSQPQLRVRGSVTRNGHRDAVTGEAWLDHEWASQYLDPAATGWDWVGLNLDDGSAVMAFEIRDRRGRRYWTAGTLRDAHGHAQVFGPGEVSFTPTRRWRSPRTGVVYPVAEQLRIGTLALQLEPLLDDQEFDARLTSGAIYWEGAVSASVGAGAGTEGGAGAGRGAGAEAGGGAPIVRHRTVGRGYLELTGYGRPLSLR